MPNNKKRQKRLYALPSIIADLPDLYVSHTGTYTAISNQLFCERFLNDTHALNSLYFPSLHLMRKIYDGLSPMTVARFKTFKTLSLSSGCTKSKCAYLSSFSPTVRPINFWYALFKNHVSISTPLKAKILRRTASR